MKILLVTARYYPEPFSITKIAEKLVSFGHEVTVLTGRPWVGKFKLYDGYENIREEVVNGVKIIRVKERIRNGSFKSLILNYSSIHRLYKKDLKKMKCDFDIVFSHVMSPIFSISYVSKFCKKHKIPHFHYSFDLWPESLVATEYSSKNSLLLKIMKKYCFKIYNSMDLISFASPSCEKYFKDYLGVNRPMKLIYQPCLTKLPDLSEIKHEKTDDKLRILYCGNIARFNHLDIMIDALNDPILQEKVLFEVVGAGTSFKIIKEQAESLGLKNIVFPGYVTPEETKKFYKSADCIFIPLYCNSSTSLMIPQKVNESLMYSRPLLGMIKGDGRDIIQKASSLNLVCDQTVDGVKKAIYKMLEYTEDDILKCGSENREYFIKNKALSLDYACRQMESSMMELIEKNNK